MNTTSSIPSNQRVRRGGWTEHRDYLVRRILAIAQADFEPLTWRACWEFVVNDRPATEVAAELGVTVNVVYLAKSRVLRHLRTELAGFLD